MEGIAREIGVSFEASNLLPSALALRLKQPRIGLWDRFGGSMDSGWMRWIFEQWEFPFRLVFPPELDAGNLGRSWTCWFSWTAVFLMQTGRETKGTFSKAGGGPGRVP